MSTITFKITGTKETSDALKNISKELKDLSIPLDDSSRSYLNVISTNFKDEGRIATDAQGNRARIFSDGRVVEEGQDGFWFKDSNIWRKPC